MGIAPIRKKPINYLSNKELLAEIAKCKRSFSVFEKPEYGFQDVIVSDLDQITDEILDQACAKKSKLLSVKGEPPVIVEKDGLIIRVMTYEHIPLDPNRKRRSRAINQQHAACTFPPFKHYLLSVDENDNRTYREVGRSHWDGDIETGQFNVYGPNGKGRVTERMGFMYKLLVDRYSKKLNWRGYCVDSETLAFTKRGWLPEHEITTNDEVLSFQDDRLKWSKIVSIYRNDGFDDKMFKMDGLGIDALVTSGHKMVTTNGIVKVDLLKEKDKIIHLGRSEINNSEKYHNSFVELVGWVSTEGTFYNDKSRTYPRISIYQNEGKNAERIRNCIASLGHKFSETKRKSSVCFNLNKALCLELNKVIDNSIGNKVINFNFILDLSTDQRMILFNTIIDGDGLGPQQNYTQKCKHHMDSFIMLCTLLGKKTFLHKNKIISFGKETEIYKANISNKELYTSYVENIDFHGAKNYGLVKGNPNLPTESYKGMVWCLETEYGSFVVKRNEKIYLTGNSYLEEMQALSLVQLSQAGLQFDESKSENPFAFFTTILKHCLSGETKILTKEYGAIEIEKISGQDVHLLDGDQNWTKCHIYDYGEQETHLTHFSRGGVTEKIWSTTNHGWKSNGERVNTIDFYDKEVSLIDDLRTRYDIKNKDDYQKGIAHGIIYADGNKSYKDDCEIVLYEDKKLLFPYLKNFISKTYNTNGKVKYLLKNTWCNLKALPDNTSSIDYLRGFIRGWFSCDGCVSKSSTPTLCGDINEYNWLKQWSPLIGWNINNYTKLAPVTNYGKRNKESLNFHIRKSSLIPDDFLREKHKNRFLNKKSRDGVNEKYDWDVINKLISSGMSAKEISTLLKLDRAKLSSAIYHHKNKPKTSKWKVYRKRFTHSTRIERVYCPVVQTTGSFALACGIHSYNCFTRVLNDEKRKQTIRDDLLQSYGVKPSYTRQTDDEYGR